MKAVVLHAENELPRVETVPEPGPPGKGKLLVRVAAAGLNYADTMMRRGSYVTKIKFPHVPGLEYSGTVEAVGEDVFGIRTGSRVMGLSPGAFAERIVVDARTALPIPERFSMEEAAGFPLVFLTAYPMLTLSAHARAGETILVHAAAGGVGTATVQLARHLGLKVIASASSDEKLERVRALGADFTINYSRENFVARVREFTSGRGADIIFESIGGDFVPKNIQALAPFGRMIVYGMASGRREAMDLGALFQNSVAVSGFWLVTLASQPRLFQEIVAELMGIIEGSQIRPIIGAVYRFERAAAAFQALESRASYGKLVLKPS
jgi:NADPH2:quinone reductase